jgi:glycosyltransferase involved in cell wall biosynthesis
MREALRELIDNHEQRGVFRLTAWRTAQAYRLERQAERLCEVYEKAQGRT